MTPTQSSDGTSVRVALFHPVLSHYRVDLFNAFDRVLGGGLTVHTGSAGRGSLQESEDDHLIAARRSARTWRVGPLWCVPSTVTHVLARRSDVIVLSWNARQVELLLVLLLARCRRMPVVLWGHGLGRTRSRVVLWLRRTQARLASVVMAYSDAGAREVRELAPDSSVVVLLNTTGRPPPTTADVLDHPTGRVAFVGRLLPRKRIVNLIEALGRLTDPALTLDIVGEGPDRAAIETAVERLELTDRVTMHGKLTIWDDVAAVLRSVDLVVIPIAAGLVVVDALACARPVMIIDDPAPNGPEADLVVDGENGFRYGPCTVDALTSRLREVYEDPDVLVSTSARAGEVYRQRLTMDGAARTFARVIDEARRPRPSGART